jgi:Ran GTPase-activating protein (RanGAP) involved in mRNA processing and transport
MESSSSLKSIQLYSIFFTLNLDNELSKENAKEMAKFIGNSKNIKILEYCNVFSCHLVEYLSETLKQNSTLHWLILNGLK